VYQYEARAPWAAEPRAVKIRLFGFGIGYLGIPLQLADDV
jgi:hypothetical protein